MPAQPHLFRLLTLLRLLNDRPGRTIAQAAVALDTTTRTVYRYLETLEELGYHIDKDDNDRHFLFETDRTHRPTFTADESALVGQLLASHRKNFTILCSFQLLLLRLRHDSVSYIIFFYLLL